MLVHRPPLYQLLPFLKAACPAPVTFPTPSLSASLQSPPSALADTWTLLQSQTPESHPCGHDLQSFLCSCSSLISACLLQTSGPWSSALRAPLWFSDSSSLLASPSHLALLTSPHPRLPCPSPSSLGSVPLSPCSTSAPRLPGAGGARSRVRAWLWACGHLCSVPLPLPHLLMDP